MERRFYVESIDSEWLQTRSGEAWFPRDPDPDLICVKDLSVCLSRLPRFGGHTREFYSVGQHSLHVRELLRAEPVEIQLAGLLHDAEEAYTGFGDLQAPIRHLAGHYRRIKYLVEDAIERRFELPSGILQDGRVRRADLVALATEKRDLLDTPPMPWRELPEPDGRIIQPWPMSRVARAYAGTLNNLINRWRKRIEERGTDAV